VVELIDVMDRVDIHEDCAPATHYRLELADGKLAPEELAAKHDRSIDVAEAEIAEGSGAHREAAKRLDG
jgi:hypothetical protein